ncbi:MAG: hypothetical protein PWQ06_328 [Anaerophaga sp.]|nr:hypothetical protein [Anaerophaga sp.]
MDNSQPQSQFALIPGFGFRVSGPLNPHGGLKPSKF